MGQVDEKHDWPAQKRRRFHSQLTLDSTEPAQPLRIPAGKTVFHYDGPMGDGNETFK